jgi:hypothetical protein
VSWAKYAIEALQRGETVKVKPRGNSMKPRVNSGDEVTLEPIKELNTDNIVLVKVRGRHYLHMIKAIDGDRYLIGNNKGHINGWVNRNAIYGLATAIQRK